MSYDEPINQINSMCGIAGFVDLTNKSSGSKAIVRQN